MNNKSKIKYGYGNFGNLSWQYAKARQGFPQEAIGWLWSLVNSRKAQILDLGCGTGISTRQIAERGGTVIGCDIDKLMIVEAKRAHDGLRFLVASAEKLPFGDAEFDAVTAFSAFHWFANQQALMEIKRVLKRSGIFYVVNKNDVGDFKRGYKEIIKHIVGKDLPEAKKNYEPEGLLEKLGFTDVCFRDLEISEYFNLRQAMGYLQSISTWNLVPDKMKPSALELLENYCLERMVEGKIERKLVVKCVVGRVS